MTTRREYFMQNPEKFYDYVWKWRGEKPVVSLDKDRARRDKEYIGIYLCDNMKDCDACPVPLDEDGLCDNRLDKWLDTLTTADMSDLVPEDREAVQKILDASMKSAKEKKVMYSPSGTADFKEFNITDAVPPRADGAETAKKAPEMVKPDHYRIEISYGEGYEDGYIKALHDLAELVKMDKLKHCITFYDEGVNAGLRKAIYDADYLIQTMKNGGVNNVE